MQTDLKKVTISRLFREKKISSKGKEYTSLRIQTPEYGDKWIGGFGSTENKDWKEGDTILIKVVENGNFLNFENATMFDVINMISQIYTQVVKLETRVTKLDGIKTENKPVAQNVEVPRTEPQQESSLF